MTKVPFLGFILLLISNTLAFSQDCSAVTVGDPDSANPYFKVRESIPLDNEKWQLAITLHARTEGKSIMLELIPEVDQLCPEKGDSIGFHFANGQIIYLTNILPSNCDKRFGIAFGQQYSNDEVLQNLRLNDVTLISLHHKGQKIVGEFRQARKALFKNVLQCLHDALTSEAAARKLMEEFEQTVYMVVDVQPEFSGGYEAMVQFLSKNMKVKKNVKGTLFVSFIVEKDGTLTEPKVLRGLTPEADAEALRMVSIMPPWIPGSLRGKTVRCRFNLPFRFK